MKNTNSETKQGGIFGRFLSKIGRSTAKQSQAPIEELKGETEVISSQSNEDHLLSTNKPRSEEEEKLVDFETETVKKNTEIEKEVPMKIEDDEETKRSESETIVEQIEDPEVFKIAESRKRSDSITSTSTNRIYSYKDLNDFVNIEELHKFLYK